MINNYYVRIISVRVTILLG